MRMTRILLRPWNPFSKQKPETPPPESYTPMPDFQFNQDPDFVRARGVRKFRKSYNPPENLEELMCSCVEEVCNVDKNSWKELSLNDTHLKFKILTRCTSQFHLAIPNSLLHEMKSVSDVLSFYSTPKSNISLYEQMCRDNHLPKNLVIKEQPDRFNPEDKEKVHGGVNAFPGEGGKVFGLRNRRLFREWTPKKEWNHYQDKYWDYSRDPPQSAPWNREQIRNMDTPGRD